MAWPCITRACCINRFWSELDKADIAVPLVFAKYSDVETDAQHLPPHHRHPPQARQQKRRAGPVAMETQHQPEPEAEAPPGPPPPRGAAAPAKDEGSASVTRQDFKVWKVRPEQSYKPRNEYQPSAAPFDTETQYQKDYKPWPIPKKGDHPWIPKAAEAPSGVEKSEIEEKVQEKESVKKERSAERKSREKEPEEQPPAEHGSAERKGRAAADALNRQIKEVVSTGSSYRNEFKAYKDVKPTKAIKAPSKYKPPVEEEGSLETSYSATFKGEQAKPLPTDNKLLERRRIRSLYNEPGKEPPKADKPAPRSKPKKTATTTTSRMMKKSKEKQVAGVQAGKKKAAAAAAAAAVSGVEPKAAGSVTKKSKEISNRLAEANQ